LLGASSTPNVSSPHHNFRANAKMNHSKKKLLEMYKRNDVFEKVGCFYCIGDAYETV
jgi:hypothetical protein